MIRIETLPEVPVVEGEGEFPRPSRWAVDRRYAGLARGWEGHAWVWLTLRSAGLVDDKRGLTLQTIARKLESERAATNATSRGFVSHLIGFGANAVLASRMWVERGVRKHVLSQILRHWHLVCESSCERDLMLGTAGALLACAEIETIAPGVVTPGLLRLLLRRTRAEAKRILARPVGEVLGFAHGLSGVLLALESARQVFGSNVDDGLVTDCRELLWSERIESPDRQCFWPARAGSTELGLHGWCHGSPGVALGLLACHAASNNADYREMAIGALHGTAVDIHIPSGTFCCGSIGRAQVLLEAYRLGGETRWLREGQRVAGLPSISVLEQVRGFHKGTLGSLYLAYRLRALSTLPLPGLGALSVVTRA